MLTHWIEYLKNISNSYSSLRYLATDDFESGKSHILIDSVGHTALDIRRAGIANKICTGTYSLRYNRTQFNQHAVNKICMLCSKETEDRAHFLVRCHSLNTTRTVFQNRIKDIICREPTEDELLQLIIDPSKQLDNIFLTNEQKKQLSIESRKLIYKLHSHRSTLVDSLVK